MAENSPPLPTDGVTDQDIDTAGTEADDERVVREGRGGNDAGAPQPPDDGDTRSPVDPASMHRAEDDAVARAGSRDFSEQPDRATSEPPSRQRG